MFLQAESDDYLLVDSLFKPHVKVEVSSMENETPENADNGNDDSSENVIEAELVETPHNQLPDDPNAAVKMTPVHMTKPHYVMPPGLENLAAVGGAVSAMVLGVFSVIGSLLTPYAAINSALGMMLGAWGLTSRKKKMASIGIVLCAVGMMMSLFEVRRIISLFFATEPEI